MFGRGCFLAIRLRATDLKRPEGKEMITTGCFSHKLCKDCVSSEKPYKPPTVVALLKDQEIAWKKLPPSEMAKDSKLPSIISLNVGGQCFTTRLSTLVKDDTSMLAAMFSGRFELEVDGQGKYFIDRDGTYFGHVLNYLRDASHLPPPSVALQVYREAQYFRVESLVDRLEYYPTVMPYAKLEEQKSTMLNKYHLWKHTILEFARKKFGDVIKFSLGQESLITVIRYISKADYAIAVSHCKTFNVGTDDKADMLKHSFFCAEEGGRRLRYYIGPQIPTVDFVIVEEDISDCRLFTSLLEKDLRGEGFSASGRTSYTWKCSRCDTTGFLHQMVFRWDMPRAQLTDILQSLNCDAVWQSE